jgi:hypothetical protein
MRSSISRRSTHELEPSAIPTRSAFRALYKLIVDVAALIVALAAQQCFLASVRPILDL